jgi:predicted metal-dependent hydrolase
MNEEIPIENVIRSRRRTIALEVTPHATVVVRAPYYAPSSAIMQTIWSKQAWILKKLREMRARPQAPVHAFEEGETFWFLGRPYPLRFTDGDDTAIRRTDRLLVPRSFQPSIHDHLKRWYKEEAAREIQARCNYFSMVTGYTPSSIRISDARRRWGSCTVAGGLNFTWRLVQAPLSIMDYVIVHELVHLRQHDHSKQYWEKVEALMPDYAERRQRMREHEWMLCVF